MNGQIIMSMIVEHLHFLDSVSFLSMALSELPQAFDLSTTKSWYPHFFNTKANRNYVGPILDIKYYGVDAMDEPEKRFPELV
jgi:hypothetical protein